MSKRLLISTVMVISFFVSVPAALAQPAPTPYAVPPSGTEQLRPQVGGAELVRTAPRAQVAGQSESRGGSLPVTGGDIAGLAAVGVALIAVGTLLRRQRRLAY